MPNKKGLVSGGILTGFGAGGFFFSLIGSKIANPNGLNPVNGRFPGEIYDNFPKMLRTLSATYALVSFIGALLVKEPVAAPAAEKSESPIGTVVATPSVPGLTVVEVIFYSVL